MKKFRFPLEKLLRVRGLRVKSAQKALSEAVTVHQREQVLCDRALDLYQRTSSSLCQQELAGIPAGDLRSGRIYLDQIFEEVAERQGAVKAAFSRVLEQRRLLVESMRDHKSLERLKEKHRLNYLQSLRREEQKSLDEVRIT